MSNSACCDLNSEGDTLKLPDLCEKAECKCQKQIMFTKGQYMLEGNGFRIKLRKIFKGTPTAWNKFLK